MKITKIILLLLSCLASQLNAQNYDDLAIVVNDNDSLSLEIGNYFANQRGIPAHRILHVQLGSSEEVDSIGFEDYRAQLEGALIAGNLLDSVNYLVTTKGLPLRISKNGACDSLAINCCFSAPILGCRSAEAELSKVLGPFAGEILQNQVFSANPYYGVDAAFSRDSFGVFIVGRLDGNTVEDVKSLVDHGGTGRPFYPPQSKVLADVYGHSQSLGIPSVFAMQVPHIDTACQMIGVPFVQDNDPQVFIGNQTDLIALHTYTFDTSGISTNTFLPGALVFNGNGFSGYSFDVQSNPQNSNSAWRFVGSGAGAIVASVSAYYVGPSCNPGQLFPFYLDTLQSWHNAGMAYYQALPFIGNQQYLLGDPKTSLRPTGTAALPGPSALGLVKIFPNPSNGILRVEGRPENLKPVHYRWMDLQGRTVGSGNLKVSSEGFNETFDLGDLPDGLYLLSLEQGASRETHRVVIQR